MKLCEVLRLSLPTLALGTGHYHCHLQLTIIIVFINCIIIRNKLRPRYAVQIRGRLKML